MTPIKLIKGLAFTALGFAPLAALLGFAPLALALGPPPPEPDSPSVQALKSQLMDEVQANLNWRTNYFTLQGQVGKLQADLQTAQAKVAQMERPAGTVAGGDAPASAGGQK